MPRPDLTEQRTDQILDAFEKCIVVNGLEGSSLEKIAEEAGMKRTILRHYIGNRDDLIDALCQRVVRRYRRQLETIENAPAGADSKKSLLGCLFDIGSGESGDDILVAESLIAAADRYPNVGELMSDYVAEFVRVVSCRLALVHPEAPGSKRWQVAYGITSLLLNDTSLVTLKLPPKYSKAARSCAAVLIDSLSPN